MIEFDEGKHQYKIDGREAESVTTWVSRRFVKPFVASMIATMKARSDQAKVDALHQLLMQVKNVDAPLQKKAMELLDSVRKDLVVRPREFYEELWKINGLRATNFGTSIHCFAQLFFMDRDYAKPRCGHELALVPFLEDIQTNYDEIQTELRVHSEKFMKAGTLDLMCVRKSDGKRIIFDYKTSEHLKVSKGYLINEMKEYPENNLMKYSAQLWSYNIIGDLKADEMYIVHVSEDDVDVVRAIDVNKEITAALYSEVEREGVEDTVESDDDIIFK